MLQQLSKAEAPLCSERSKRKGNSSEEFASFETSSTTDDLSYCILRLTAPKKSFWINSVFLDLQTSVRKRKKKSNQKAQKAVIKCDLS